MESIQSIPGDILSNQGWVHHLELHLIRGLDPASCGREHQVILEGHAMAADKVAITLSDSNPCFLIRCRSDPVARREHLAVSRDDPLTGSRRRSRIQQREDPGRPVPDRLDRSASHRRRGKFELVPRQFNDPQGLLGNQHRSVCFGGVLRRQ